MLTLQAAQQALVQRSNNNTITAQDVSAMLSNVRGVTFASVMYVADVATAAAHKHNVVQKVVHANVQLFNNVADYSNVYAAAVKRSAAKISDNAAGAVSGFEQQDSYFTHTACFSVVQHKTKPKHYLYAIYNAADSLYFINAQPATKQQVAALLTPSAAKQLLAGTDVVHNKTHDVMHTVQVRTIALESIVQLTAQRQQLAA